MEKIVTFINDPLVAPLYGLLVVTLFDLLLGIYRSIQGGVFDWSKLPQVIDTVVLQRVLPLAALGAASFLVTDGSAKLALQLAYSGGCALALAGEVADFIAKITGSYVATTRAQDKEE